MRVGEAHHLCCMCPIDCLGWECFWTMSLLPGASTSFLYLNLLSMHIYCVSKCSFDYLHALSMFYFGAHGIMLTDDFDSCFRRPSRMNRVTFSLFLLTLAISAMGVELTFDMKPHVTECFHEVANKGDEVFIDYQVVYGGRLDIDVEIKFGDTVLWSARRSQTNEHSFRAHESGEYMFCFSNQFSTVSHKTVYIDVTVGDEEPVLEEDGKKHATALTQMETSVAAIHDAMRKSIGFQTHLRLREANHRRTADFMNERVQWVSAGEALLLVVVSVFQLMYLRSLFEKKPGKL
eukprot:m.156713 g.156713  ORF g.156713 m.156713 type:complete len:291 (-) comp14330_c1_seq3:1461-2333(-)